MRVEVSDRTYIVSFRNRSEKIIHDAAPPSFEAWYKRKPIPADVPANDVFRVLPVELRDLIRRHTKLRVPKRISLATTVCTITDKATGNELARGHSYYSKSEVQAKKPFNKMAAKARSLMRALGQDISHRTGDIFTEAERAEFWRAFEHLAARRQSQVAATNQAAGSPSVSPLP